MEQNKKELENYMQEETNENNQNPNEEENEEFSLSKFYDNFLNEYGIGGILTLIVALVVAISFPFSYIYLDGSGGAWAFIVAIITTIVVVILSPLSAYLAMLGWNIGSAFNFIGGVFGWSAGLIVINVFIVSFAVKLL